MLPAGLEISSLSSSLVAAKVADWLNERAVAMKILPVFLTNFMGLECDALL